MLDFKRDRQTLIKKLQQVYANIKMKFPKIESGEQVIDIDPFTVYGLFNKGITNANRTLIMKGISTEFGIKALVPVEFDGIPVLNNLSATFYRFKDERGESDIDNLWNVFESALALAEEDTPENRQLFSEYYDIVCGQQGIRWNITMALYWIRPYTFVNLDSRNRWYMTNPDHMPAEFVSYVKEKLGKVPSATEYLEIRDVCKKALQNGGYEYKSFPELSYFAWLVSEKDNQENGRSHGKKSNVSNAAFLRWFRPLLQALRDLGGSATPAEAKKKIIENEHLTQKEVNETRGKNNVNKFGNEVDFARSYLVNSGYMDKSVYGVWTLTEEGKTVDMTDELASSIFKNGVAETQSKRESSGKVLADENANQVHYWVYAPGRGAEKWEEMYRDKIAALGWGEIGDLMTFAGKDEIKQKMKEVYGNDSSYKNSAHAVWQFSREMKAGDIIYAQKGKSEIVGRGVVASDYEYDDSRTDHYNNVREIKWTHEGSWSLEDKQLPMKTLTDITPYSDLVTKVESLFEDDILEDEDEQQIVYKPYSPDDFLQEVYMSEAQYNMLTALVRNKKNVILQGTPGVGKTFVAKRLAYSMMGEKDTERVEMVQFHQSYSYEDFIEGFRPTTAGGFELKKGSFYKFCRKAEIDSDNEYFFIIDEINRGNLSKIFGELFMLIENDKRDIELQLLYSGEKFAVPSNVYIIGMMNTADRSLAMLDYALRRRFAFIDIKPGFETDGFREYRMNLDNDKFNRLISCVESLNHAISADESLGDGFCIGHSYFCNFEPEELDEQCMTAIVEFELVPLLKEYWFDEPVKVKDWSEKLRGAVR